MSPIEIEFNTDGRPPAPPAPVDSMIYHCAVPTLPQFRFEWHPVRKTVYLIVTTATPLVGDPIAENITDQGQAINATLLWCRGYQYAKRELPRADKS